MKNTARFTALSIATLVLSPLSIAANLAKQDMDFINKAAQAGQYEVQSGRLAQSKASAAETKSFAGQMVTDHTKANDELKALVQGKGAQVPAEPSDAQKLQLKTLGSAEGGNFDKAYAKDNVAAHEDAVKLFRTASKDAADADLKAFAARTLPTLEHHLEMAKSLDSSVKK